MTVDKSSHAVRPVRDQNSGSLWNLTAAPLSAGRWLQIANQRRTDSRGRRPPCGRVGRGMESERWRWGSSVASFLTRRALRPIQRLHNTARKVIDSGILAFAGLLNGEPMTSSMSIIPTFFQRPCFLANEALVRGMREALDTSPTIAYPLTRLRTGAEVALRDVADPQRVRDALADTLEESDQVLAMLKT